eukprot:Gregarina_sp_Poly_1__1766@NODE_1458_length_4095_cov_178_894985_g965_i0_p3_GENE_NODE_1458_length_4095_cov_178_894985_g965_i0NODE_1458_length_4095_cov_178_894985_g965_i0_p3_ORF_typecomplete_len213_score34_34Ribosomal_S8e/PF01201_22/4_8e54_NODE_1458_length_4095_cov_178_894985_g965_i020132651
MGICRDSRHKRRATGGKRAIHQKKRKFELGRPSSNTKLGASRIHLVRCRGGAIKHRALRLDAGNYSWGSEHVACKTKVISVVYNATSNELVRTNTITKGTIVMVDATPFKTRYQSHYGVELGKKKVVHSDANEEKKDEVREPAKQSPHVLAKLKYRLAHQKLDSNLEEQFGSGRLLACVSSRPGQSGRADGYILEGKELDFYRKKLDKKKKN